jgi:GAF domain-containing protein
VAQEFINKYKAAYGEVPDDVAALTYDAFGMLFQAIESQSKADPESIRNGLTTISQYEGVTGMIEYKALGIHDDDGARQWTDEEIVLVEAVAERMALAAENLRLFDETQRRAERERVIREISDQMQRATGMEALMRIMAEGLNRALGGSRTYVRLGRGRDRGS